MLFLFFQMVFTDRAKFSRHLLRELREHDNDVIAEEKLSECNRELVLQSLRFQCRVCAFASDVDTHLLEHLAGDAHAQASSSLAYASDLTVILISPSGTRATLFAEVGGDGVLRGNLRIDDEARRSLPLNSRPPKGAYRPTDNAGRSRPPADLSVFDGEDPNGTWRLRIIDGYESDGGRLNGVRLILRTH